MKNNGFSLELNPYRMLPGDPPLIIRSPYFKGPKSNGRRRLGVSAAD